MSQITDGFSSWLNHLNYSTNTIRSYLADVSKFYDYLSTRKSDLLSSKTTHLFTVNLLRNYLSSIYGQNNYNHQIASLRLFCQFCQDQSLLPADTFTKAYQPLPQGGNSEKSTIDTVLAEYKQFLQLQKASPNTIRNYLADIKDYLLWSHEKSL